MKKLVLLTIGSLVLLSFAHAQQIEQLSYDAGYLNQVYYDIQSGETTVISHADWDIAFSAANRNVGIFINEGAASTTTDPQPELELYLTQSTDFSDVDTVDMQRLYNNEANWSEGAFNHVKKEGNSLDMGWGTYDPATHAVNGQRIFVIKLRNGLYQKVLIESLSQGVYTLKYANLDGSNEKTATIDKSEFKGKTLAYFSFEESEVRDLEPAEWDLLFTRYTTPLDDGNGNMLQYLVTGVLSNVGVELAEANGIDPESVKVDDYLGKFSDVKTTIGYDWKSFDLNTFSWFVPDDRVYFIKADQEIWKIQFIDFEGSSTGVVTFLKTFEQGITASRYPGYTSDQLRVFPNPVMADRMRFQFADQHQFTKGALQIFNAGGVEVYSDYIELGNGRSFEFTGVSELQKGVYHLRFETMHGIYTSSFIVQ